jgi:uncharacterized SAM-binding protein YcdF (DUF218 family)
MFFILSKILFFLLVPFWWIMILFVWRLFSKSVRTKKNLLVAIILFAIVFTNPFLYRWLVMQWQPEPVTITPGKTYEAGILLGGLSGYDKNERGYFGNNSDRFIQAANLYHQGIIKRIIVSGGTGKLSQDEPAESFFLRTQLIANGIPDSAILIESRSKNTYENAVYSKRITDSLHLSPPFVLVTSAWHMTRSASVFKKAGFDCIAFPCDYKVVPLKFAVEDAVLPNISLLNEWSMLIKEVVGLYVYKLTGKA